MIKIMTKVIFKIDNTNLRIKLKNYIRFNFVDYKLRVIADVVRSLPCNCLVFLIKSKEAAIVSQKRFVRK